MEYLIIFLTKNGALPTTPYRNDDGKRVRERLTKSLKTVDLDPGSTPYREDDIFDS